MIRKKTTVQRALPTLIVLLTLFSGNALAAVKAWLNQNTVYIGDPVVLTISVDGNTSGKPDLSPLNRDFRILGTGSSSNVSIINGVTSSSRNWTIRLQPLKKGQLTIPSLSINGEKTSPLTLTVADVPPQVKARQREHAQIEIDTGKTGKSVYVQQQITFTVKLLTDDSILSGDLQFPPMDDAVVEQITRDRKYQITRNGKTWNVLERRYVISPQRSGKLTIPAVIFKGTRRQTARRQRARDPFDRFFNDPFADDFFAGTPFGPRGTPIQTSSEPMTIEVKPVPSAYTGKNWLPAESVELTDSWAASMPEFHVGEPVTRSLKLQVKGLAGSQIPAISPGEPADISLYSDRNNTETRTDGETIYGISEQTYTYMPRKAGKKKIPAITIDWWNTKTNKQESTTLPARIIEVLPGAGGVSTSAPPRQPSPAATPKPQPQNPTASAAPASSSQPENDLRRWWWTLPLIALAGLLAIVIVRRRPRKTLHDQHPSPGSTPDPSAPAESEKLARRELHQACQSGNAHDIAAALLKLGKAVWPDDPPMSLGKLAERVAEGGEAIRQLDRQLYGNGGGHWQSEVICQKFRNGFSVKTAKTTTADTPVTALYPDR